MTDFCPRRAVQGRRSLLAALTQSNSLGLQYPLKCSSGSIAPVIEAVAEIDPDPFPEFHFQVPNQVGHRRA